MCLICVVHGVYCRICTIDLLQCLCQEQLEVLPDADAQWHVLWRYEYMHNPKDIYFSFVCTCRQWLVSFNSFIDMRLNIHYWHCKQQQQTIGSQCKVPSVAAKFSREYEIVEAEIWNFIWIEAGLRFPRSRMILKSQHLLQHCWEVLKVLKEMEILKSAISLQVHLQRNFLWWFNVGEQLLKGAYGGILSIKPSDDKQKDNGQLCR